MFESRWRVKTPRADFRVLALRDRIVDEALAREIWLFARRELEHGDPDALLASRELVRELGDRSEHARDASVPELVEALEFAVFAGRLQFEPIAQPIAGSGPAPAVDLADLTDAEPLSPPPADKPTPETPTTFFEVFVVDEIGEPVDGVDVLFETTSGSQTVTTDGTGKARLDPAQGDTAVARLADLQAVRDVMFPRWEQARSGEKPSGAEFVDVLVRDPLDPVALNAEQAKTMVLAPHVVRVRLTGMFFDNAKAFLLPGAMNGISKLRDLYDELPEARFLIVGHTNTLGEPDYNNALSLERAESIFSFLGDRVDDWLAFYGSGISWEKRWGTTEDAHMLGALPVDSDEKFLGGGMFASYRRYQEAKGLPLSGTGDAATRRALVTDYMAHDRTSLPPSVQVTTHGCGESFPEVQPGEDEHNRRVEIFVFDGPITPPPQGEISGPDATDYPAWRALTIRSFDFSSGTSSIATTSVFIRFEQTAEEAAASSDRAVLSSSDGISQERVVASEHVPSGTDGDAVDLEFTEVPMEGRYTLTIESSDGPYLLFADVPFEQLATIGITPPEPADTSDDPPSAAVAGIDQPVDTRVA